MALAMGYIIFLISALPDTSYSLSPRLVNSTNLTFPFFSYSLNSILPWISYMAPHLLFLYTLQASPSILTSPSSTPQNALSVISCFRFSVELVWIQLIDIFFYYQVPQLFHAEGPCQLITGYTGASTFLGRCSAGRSLDLLFSSTQYVYEFSFLVLGTYFSYGCSSSLIVSRFENLQIPEFSQHLYTMTEVQKIKFYRAILKRDLRTFSDMIPFLVVEVGGLTKKTMSDQKGGKKPTWNETFEFKTSETLFNVSVFDENSFGDELIGKAKFDIQTLTGLEKEEIIDIEHQQKVIGKLFIKVLTALTRYPSLELEPQSPTKSIAQNERRITENQRRTLENAACSLLGGPLKQNLPSSNPLSYLSNSPIPQQSTQSYQQPIQAPQPQMHIPQVMSPPPVYYGQPQYPTYQAQLQPQPQPQVYHGYSVPANMIISPNHNHNQGNLSANRNLQQHGQPTIIYMHNNNKKAKNHTTFSSPFKDLTDLLL